MGDEHRFTEEEVKVILAWAVDLERAGTASPDVGGSLSLTELKEIASEAGIDEALVEAAVSDFLAPRPSRPSTWLGPAPRSTASRLLNNEHSSQNLGLLMRLVEDRSNRRGLVTEALGRITWVSQQAQLRTEVSLSNQRGRARIDVEGSYPGQMRSLLQLIPGAIGLTAAVSVAAPAGLFGAPLVALAFGGGVLGAALGRGIWEVVARTNSRATENFADEVAAAVAELGNSVTTFEDEVL